MFGRRVIAGQLGLAYGQAILESRGLGLDGSIVRRGKSTLEGNRDASGTAAQALREVQSKSPGRHGARGWRGGYVRFGSWKSWITKMSLILSPALAENARATRAKLGSCELGRSRGPCNWHANYWLDREPETCALLHWACLSRHCSLRIPGCHALAT